MQEAAQRVRPGGMWAHVMAACEYNEPLGERVLLYAEVDWGRVVDKLGGVNRLDLLFKAAFCWEWWAVAAYRLSYWVNARKLPDLGRARVLQKLLDWQQGALLRFCFALNRVMEGLSGARISPLADIGPGFLLAHTGSCGVGAGVRIGDWFTMHQDSNVMGRGGGESAPVLGKCVVLYSGARVLGAVKVGDNVRVGANALVLHDLPPDCVAIGVPARPVVAGERPAGYPGVEQVRDLVATLVQAGELREVGAGRYVDARTGEEIVFENKA